MRNAKLSVLWVLLLGTSAWASAAAAQTDHTEEGATEGDAVPPGDATEGPADTSGAPAQPDGDADPADEGEDSTAVEPDSGELGSASTESVEPAVEPTPGEAEAAPAVEPPVEEEDSEAAAEPLPWRNSLFSWTHALSFNTFLRDSQLTWDPTYQQSFSLIPRWYLGPESYFLVSLGLSVELTDSVDARNRDLFLSDGIVEFRQLIPWEGFVFTGAARIGLPLSKASQAVQRYMQWGLGLTVSRPIPEANLTLAANFGYRNWLAGSNVVQVGEPQPDRCSAAPPTPSASGAPPEIETTTCDQVGTASAARDIIVTGLSATLAFGDLSINLQGFLFMLQGFELAPAYAEIATSPEPVMIADGSPSHWRNYYYVALTVAYQVAPWLELSLGVQNAPVYSPIYNPDGSARSPFTPDTQLFLSATVQLDALYTELSGAGGETQEERNRRRQGLASGSSSEVSF